MSSSFDENNKYQPSESESTSKISHIEQKETEKLKSSDKEHQIPAAGTNEFNINITKQIASLSRYGLDIFSESMEFTKQFLTKQEQIKYKEISKDYEIIDDSLKHMIPTDIDHNHGQILLMKSDTRIQNRITGLLISIGIELPIRDWSWFDILITGILKCGTIKIINYIDRDLIGKILLGLCWVIPPFITHFFDDSIDRFVSNIVIQIHSFVCLLMTLFGIYDIVTSLNKYDWKKSLLFSSILILFSLTFYLLFYSQNILNSLLCVVVIPFCWRFIRNKSNLNGYCGERAVDKKRLKEIYTKQCDQELYMNECEYVVDRVHEITMEVLVRRRRRRWCSFCSLLVLWICFVLKFFGHLQYMTSQWNLNGFAVDDKRMEDARDGMDCDENDDDFLCIWLSDEVKLMEYFDVLREHGFDNMELICSLNYDNLRAMQICKQAHINLIIKYTKSKQCQSVQLDLTCSLDSCGV